MRQKKAIEYNTTSRLGLTRACAYCLLFVMVLLSSGSVASFLANIDNCMAEITDHCEPDAESEKKEGKEETEKEIYLSNIHPSGLFHYNEDLLQKINSNNSNSFNIDIITPPPERV
ncbi:MAG: hypothetical protein WD077_08270 [Bacteroidia bacterium]